MYTEIVKIIEGGMVGDKEKVFNYARVLADNLEKSGDKSLSKRIGTLLNGRRNGMVSLDSFASKPVDTESRMDMVDIYYPGSSFDDPVLRPYVTNQIAEFVASYQQRDEILRAGVDTVNSLLLYGPPGCGKTTVAQYISFLTKLPLLIVRLDGLVSSLLGSTAKNIRKVFDYASKRECILFLDEFDVVAKLRDDRHELGELKRVVNSLLQNIDNFNNSSILIAATNHHELLDPAVWRRFANIINLDKPSKEEIQVLIRTFLQSMNSNVLAQEKKMEKVAISFEGMSHADVKTVVNNSIKNAIINKRKTVNNWDLLQEGYLYRNHKIVSDNDFIKYLIQHGVSQKEINEGFGYSLRKIREVSKMSD